jgi:hypothetical protein
VHSSALRHSAFQQPHAERDAGEGLFLKVSGNPKLQLMKTSK